MKPLLVTKVPVPPTAHPEPPHPALMTHEFTAGLIAPKGAGKTTVICNLLGFYRNYFHTILVFSPTVDSDEKWDWVKKQKLLKENRELEKFLKDLKGEASIVQNDCIVERKKVFDPYIPEEHFFADYDEEKFVEIMEEQKALISFLKKKGKTKYLANRILIIFDDLVGSKLFAGARQSYFKGVNTRHRHYSASFLMVSQGYKEVPKTIRTNWSALIVFEIGNEKEVLVIYEEFAMGYKFDDWIEMYRYATDGDHDFLYINFQRPKRLRMMKNFTEIIYKG